MYQSKHFIHTLLVLFTLSFGVPLMACTNCNNFQLNFELLQSGFRETTVLVKISTSSGSVNLAGLSIYFYYDDNETSLIASDDSQIIGSPLNFGPGNKSEIIHETEDNPNVSITHTGYYFYQNIDDDLSGFSVTTSPTTVLSLVFNHTDGDPEISGEGFLASTCEVNALAWANSEGDEFDVCVTGLQSRFLPVELIDFSAHLVSNHSILNWSTATESFTDYFEIQRQSAASSEWQRIGMVEAKGHSRVEQNYQFIDSSIDEYWSHTLFYRLKIIDEDGQYEYSEIRSIEVNSPLDIQVYPNPSDGNFMIRCDRMKSVTIFDFKGNVVVKEQLSTHGDTRKFNWGAKLSSGVYHIRVESEHGHISTKRIVVQ